MGVGHNAEGTLGTGCSYETLHNFRSVAFKNACNINLSGEARTVRPLPLGPRSRIRILNSTQSLYLKIELTILACIPIHPEHTLQYIGITRRHSDFDCSINNFNAGSRIVFRVLFCDVHQ